MVKVKYPLMSESASGTIGKAITYGFNQAGNWARFVYKKTTPRGSVQDEIRTWFKDTIDYFADMVEEERFLWRLVLKNIKEYNVGRVKQTARTARCHLSHYTLSTKSFIWNSSPFPPELIQWLITDEIPDWEELKTDLQFISKVNFNDTFNAYFFPYLGIITSKGHPSIGKEVSGLANARGVAIALNEPNFITLSEYNKRVLVAHEMTHILMSQHGWKSRNKILLTETIAGELAIRTAQKDLTPIYTYQDKTLSEWLGI